MRKEKPLVISNARMENLFKTREILTSKLGESISNNDERSHKLLNAQRNIILMIVKKTNFMLEKSNLILFAAQNLPESELESFAKNSIEMAEDLLFISSGSDLSYNPQIMNLYFAASIAYSRIEENKSSFNCFTIAQSYVKPPSEKKEGANHTIH